MDGCIGRCESVVAHRLKEELLATRISGSRARERHEVNPPEGPVEKKHASPIRFGELRVPIANDPGRRAATEVSDGCDHVAKVGGHPPGLRPLWSFPPVV